MTAIAGAHLSKLYSDLNNAIQFVAEKHNMRIQAVKAQFGDGDRNGKILLELNEPIQPSKTIARQNFEDLASKYGLKPEDYLARFSLKGNDFEVIALRIKPCQNAMLVRCFDDGKEYVLPVKAYKDAKSRGDVTVQSYFRRH